MGNYERLLESSFDGIISVDHEYLVTGFNKKAEEILKYALDEVIHKPVNNLYFDPSEPRNIGKLLHSNPEGKLENYNTFIKSKIGEKIPICLSATWLFDIDGNRIGSAGYFRDLRNYLENENFGQMLSMASNAVASADNLDQGLQNLAKIIVDSFDVTFCCILLIASDKQSLLLNAFNPLPPSDILVWDPSKNKDWQPFIDKNIIKNNKILSLRNKCGFR